MLERKCKCGRSTGAGWTDGESHHARCCACETALALRGMRFNFPGGHTKRVGVCACCGQPGTLTAFGLRRRCYQRRYRAGRLDEWKAFIAIPCR
jgi:hypothetical protein